jgi:succinate dehydrogenase / fumarate reductase flavoprotein subunit
VESYAADAVLLATGGYSTVFFLSTNAVNCNATAVWRCHKRGALFANPCFTQIHPTCVPLLGESQSKLTLMSESLRNDGRVWVPKGKDDKRPPNQIPEGDRDYFLERIYPAFGNLVPRDIASRAAKRMCDSGHGVGNTGYAVYLDFADAISRMGRETVRERYGNLFQMYDEITGEDPYQTPMRIYPAPHYTMGGLWVDYGLMSNIPGLHVLGEANFSDHGANRLGASALMQGLADGYFVIPYTLGNYLATSEVLKDKVTTEHAGFKEAEARVNDATRKLLSIKGTTTVRDFHWRLGRIMWDDVGMSRTEESLKRAIQQIRELRARFWQDVNVVGGNDFNKELEFAGRVADFLELGELMAIDALQRNESCGGHFRDEYQYPDGEALRDDDNFAHVAAWKYNGDGVPETLIKEHLSFEDVKPTKRSYK